jgi:hypothetical protein
MKKTLPTYTLILLTVLVSWIWANQPGLSYYTLQLVSLIVLIWLAIRFLGKELPRLPQSLIFLLIVCLLVFSTGDIASPLFFLIYFLLFGFSFLLSPSASLFLSLVLALVFFPFSNSAKDWLTLSSLLLIAPLSYFFGQEYLHNLTANKRIKIYQKSWLKDEKLLETQGTNALFWLSLNLKPGLQTILDKTSLLLGDIAHLTPTQKQLIKSVRRKTKKLLRGAEKLERLMENKKN